MAHATLATLGDRHPAQPAAGFAARTVAGELSAPDIRVPNARVMRKADPQVTLLLMDPETLLAHRPYWGEEPEPTRQDLTAQETTLYDDLRFNRIQPRLRLEQERVGFGWLNARLCDEHLRGFITA